MADKSIIITVEDGDNQASKSGLSGKYDLLEFNDWNLLSHKDMREHEEYSKTLLLHRDGKIESRHFEGSVGVHMNIEQCGAEERQNLIKLYDAWKESRK